MGSTIWLLFLIVILSSKTILTINLRCNEDIDGSLQLIEDCRACVIFIVQTSSPATIPTTTVTSVRRISTSNDDPSIEDLFLFDEKKRRRRRQNNDPIIRQSCARELDGPLYGYDQTHCYCNSPQCNSNIQRCIYEVTSKRHFACYHGTNSSQYPIEIRHKCRSCRVRLETNSMYNYECLTFAEREQTNRTQCTCQRPMCNQDRITCERFQLMPSRSRVNSIFETTPESTTTTTKISTEATTSSTITTKTTTTTSSTTTTTSSSSTTTTTQISTTLTIATEKEDTSTIVFLTENVTLTESIPIDITSTAMNEIKELKTVLIEIKNQACCISSIFIFVLLAFQSFFLFVCSL